MKTNNFLSVLLLFSVIILIINGFFIIYDFVSYNLNNPESFKVYKLTWFHIYYVISKELILIALLIYLFYLNKFLIKINLFYISLIRSILLIVPLFDNSLLQILARLKWLAPIFFFFLVCQSNIKVDFKKIFHILNIAVLLNLIFQLFCTYFLFISGNDILFSYRLSGIFINPNSSALFICMSLIFAFIAIHNKYFLLLIIILYSASIFLTYSVAGFIVFFTIIILRFFSLKIILFISLAFSLNFIFIIENILGRYNFFYNSVIGRFLLLYETVSKNMFNLFPEFGLYTNSYNSPLLNTNNSTIADGFFVSFIGNLGFFSFFFIFFIVKLLIENLNLNNRISYMIFFLLLIFSLQTNITESYPFYIFLPFLFLTLRKF